MRTSVRTSARKCTVNKRLDLKTLWFLQTCGMKFVYYRSAKSSVSDIHFQGKFGLHVMSKRDDELFNFSRMSMYVNFNFEVKLSEFQCFCDCYVTARRI